MVTSKAESVAEYLADLPDARRKDIEKVRALVKKHLPKGFKEQMLYGMISWVIPLSRYPDTYNGQPLAVASLAAQKGYGSLYLNGIYASAGARERFEAQYKASGKKLDMGKACLRFKHSDDLAVEVIGASLGSVTPDDFIALYEASRRKR